MEEVWKDVVGYEGYYKVSNLGNVKSLDRIVDNEGKYFRHLKGKPKAQKQQHNGYMTVNLYKNGINKQYKTFRVHRLVAEAFLPNPNNLPFVNHKDENKQNNNVNNLEWCTQQYNNEYGTARERQAKSNSKTVYQYTLEKELVKVWDSTKATEKEGFIQGIVSKCCLKIPKYKTHKGYIWSYELL